MEEESVNKNAYSKMEKDRCDALERQYQEHLEKQYQEYLTAARQKFPVVKLSFGERFLNWHTNTDFYIRRKRGRQEFELHANLAKQLNEWFESLDEIKRLREFERKEKETK